MGKNRFVRGPAHYGLEIAEYQRHEAAERDKSWSAQGVDIEALIEKVCAYDAYVGASLRLIRTFGLRRKESVMLRPAGRTRPKAGIRMRRHKQPVAYPGCPATPPPQKSARITGAHHLPVQVGSANHADR